MPLVEQRVVGGANRPKVGAGKIAPRETPAPEPEPVKKSRLPWIIIGVLVAGIVAGAAYFLLVLKGDSGEPAAPPEPVAGEMVAIESLNVNLADGRYLRIGLGVQLTDKAHEFDPTKAKDAVIALFSGRPVGEVTSAEGRVQLKGELTATLSELYEGDVMAVYLTDFVTQ